ncbi:fibronectin type III domain-containing protein [Pseudomonas sp. CHM02]|uniref:fibronectin type III domain-containing protein n=1 Tax=Pseudomonas sp. CHM02 TaxID=1463662 RepID=UPI0035284944
MSLSALAHYSSELVNFAHENGPQDIIWSPTARAESYEISHDKMDRPSIQTENSAKFDNLVPGTGYEFRVAPLSRSGVVGGGFYWDVYTLS